MAILFPLKINNTRLFVNPEKISVRKRTDISRVKTMAGTTFQAWPDLPDELAFEGVFYGLTALLDMRTYQQAIQTTPESKEVVITYKFRKYPGYILDMEIGNDAGKPRQFPYKFTFVSKSPVNMTDMLLGQLSGLSAEFDFIQAEIRGATTTIAGLPASVSGDLQNISNNIGRLGLNIGRPGNPAIPSF